MTEDCKVRFESGNKEEKQFSRGYFYEETMPVFRVIRCIQDPNYTPQGKPHAEEFRAKKAVSVFLKVKNSFDLRHSSEIRCPRKLFTVRARFPPLDHGDFIAFLVKNHLIHKCVH